VFARLKRAKVPHLPVSSVLDYVEILFEKPDSEQTIVVGRLFFKWNPKPCVIWIERAKRRCRGLEANRFRHLEGATAMRT
jgi:hypothetical protein